ncbi:hypothetical protein BH10ACT8_BH10ACT8_29050 [soil metagenome]
MPLKGHSVCQLRRRGADGVGMVDSLWNGSGYFELARQRSVQRYGLTCVDPRRAKDAHLQQLVELAQRLTGAQHAAVHILDGTNQVRIAASAGIPLDTTDRALSMCDVAIGDAPGTELCICADASTDPRFLDNPYVTGELASIRFYAAAPLVGDEGLPLGTLCVWSDQPLTPEASHRHQLTALRDAVMITLTERRDLHHLRQLTGRPDPAAVGSSATSTRRTSPVPQGWNIDDVIDDRAVRTVFQPIVHLATGNVVGFEALSRGPAGSELEMPNALISAARSAGRLGELDWLCRVHALQAASASNLHPSLSWLINVEPAGLAMECPPHLRGALAKARTDLRVILEVVERDVEGYVTHLLRATDRARADAWGVALDDVGAEQASLALLPLLQPDVVKLDMSLVQGVPAASAASITAAVRGYAERKGAVILAEGIETEEHERLARVFGATFAQGFRYGRPGPLPASLPTPRDVIPIRQRPEEQTGNSPFDTLARSLEPQRAKHLHLRHIPDHLQGQALKEQDGCVVLASLPPQLEFDAELQERFAALAESCALTVMLADGGLRRYEPRYQLAAAEEGSRIRGEWTVITIGPNYAGAFSARDCGDGTAGAGDAQRYDFVYTHDRELVVAAGRAFIQALLPQVECEDDLPLLSANPERQLPTLGRAAEAGARTGFGRLLSRRR